MGVLGSRMDISVDQYFESTLDSVSVAEGRVVELATEMGFDEEEVYHLGYAVHEAMVNAVVHGNRYSANKRIHFVVSKSERSMEVSIQDEGEGFDPGDNKDPLANENLMRESGRGIAIIQAFVDEVSIQPALPAGTRITMRKNLPNPAV
jgi:serine/threonine-protein kinase RsbW